MNAYSYLLSNEGVCRAALATQGLLTQGCNLYSLHCLQSFCPQSYAVTYGVKFVVMMTTSSCQPADNHGPPLPSV